MRAGMAQYKFCKNESPFLPIKKKEEEHSSEYIFLHLKKRGIYNF